jgi:CRISPR-associated endonuclease Cas2
MLMYLVTYDVSCNRRRRKVSDLLEGYGKRVQWSVFECQLSTKKYQELRDEQRSVGDHRLQPRSSLKIASASIPSQAIP